MTASTKVQSGQPAAGLFRGLRPLDSSAAIRDALAGVSLAAMIMPQALGYARIAGTPIITGLYTLLLPLVAFAAFGSSRYLVVAADSATAAILAAALSKIALAFSGHYLALAGMVALLTAGFLLVARLFRLGFLADFLSQTVLVGFLTGVGFQVGIAMLGEMLGVRVDSKWSLQQLAEVISALPEVQVQTLSLAAAAVTIVIVLRSFAPRFPGPLFVVAGAIVASAALDFSSHGIGVVEHLTGGLPPVGLPDVGWREIPPLFPVAASCFLMIVAQSGATARAYATRHHQSLDEDADLAGLAAANLAAALSGSFVVNGSPTKTAMVESVGGRSQLAHLVSAAIVAAVLLFLTGPLHYLPRCVLGAIVFTIAIDLVDLHGLREIRRESAGEFWLAVITAAVVVLVGVEQGILLAIVLSLLRHLRHSYRPYTAVMIEDHGHWRPTAAVPGQVSGPGLVIFHFGADLFFANAGRFAADVRGLVEGMNTPVECLLVDAGAITAVDYSAARVLRDLLQDLNQRGVTLALVHLEASFRSDLQRHRLSEIIGEDHMFDSLHEALAAVKRKGPPVAGN